MYFDEWKQSKIDIILIFKQSLCLLLLSINYVSGQSWYPISLTSDTVKIYCFYNDTSAGETYIGGYFNNFNGISAHNIIKWNGQQLLAVGDGFNHAVHSITKYKGNIIAGGEFDSSGLTQFKMPIAKLIGTMWIPFDSTTLVTNPYPFNPRPIIQDIEEFDNRLFVIGQIYHSGPFPGTNNFDSFAFWNDTIWQPGVRPTILLSTPDYGNLKVYNNVLYIGGTFGYDSCSSSLQQGFNAYGLLRYNPICLSIEQIGTGWGQTVIHSMLEFNGSLYLGLEWNYLQYGSYITRFDGVNFYPVGVGLNYIVEDLIIYLNQLCAVGQFTADGNNTQTWQSHIAIWNGVSWDGLVSSCNTNGPAIMKAGSIDSILFISGPPLGNCGAQSLGFSAMYPYNLTSTNSMHESRQFTIYPNPNNGDFNISYFLQQSKKSKLSIFDINGYKVYEMLLPYSSNFQDLHFSKTFKNGIYNFVITSENERWNEKIVIINK